MHPPPAPFAPVSRSRFRPLAILVAALAMLTGVGAHAAEVEGLHDAEVKVRGQGEGERERGFEAALREVIVRLSGNAEAPQNPDLEEVLDAPERYVQSFSYRAIDDDELDAMDAADDGGDEPPTDYLTVSFNGSRLERDLREQEIAIWGERRPEVLLWVAVDEGRERYIVGADDGDESRAALQKRGRMRGLPLMLPLLDVEDRERVDFIDIRAPFLDAVEHASERYRADTILLGHITRRGEEQWTADWTLLDDDREVQWRVRGDDRDTLLNAGVDGATERIAAREAGRDGELVELRIDVAALDSLAAYTRVADYLDSLARVTSANVERVRGDRARFRVELQGRPEELQRVIAAGSLLDPAVAPEAADELAPVTDAEALDELVDDLTTAASADGADDDTEAGDERPAEPVRLFYRFAG